MSKCKKGLHEMTEDNTKLDRNGRKHCRPCIRERQSGYHAGSQGVGRHNKGFNKERTAMDEILEANPPVIEWRKKNNGVRVAVSVYDPHAETSAQAQAERLRYAAQLALEEEARENAAQYERDRAEYERRRRENTSLMQAARTPL